MPNKIRLEVLGFTYNNSHYSGAYKLILGEVDGQRRISVVIGQSEAQSIAIQLQGLEAPRPLTHDLLVNVMKSYNVSLREVFIYKFEKEIFFSELLCWQEGEDTRIIDARTSDAIALAIRVDCPIYIDEEILDTFKFVFDTDSDITTAKSEKEEEVLPSSPEPDPLENASITELESWLQDAINVENYELASKIRDEIKKRSKNNS